MVSRSGHALKSCRRRTDVVTVTVKDESGFSLVESIIAITIAATVFLSSAMVLGQALKGTLLARQNEQVAELISAEIESLRGLDYAAIAMRPTDLNADPAISTTSPRTVDHDGEGLLGQEPLALSATGAVNPHRSVLIHNATEYTLTRYVSEVVDSCPVPPGPNPCLAVPDAAVKRVTVTATWSSGGTERERRASTLVTRTRRGLPLPEFTFGEPKVLQVAPGGNVVFPASLTNNGARDRWNLSIATTPAITGTWSWYIDGATGTADGRVNAGDLELTDSDGDASVRVDTGLLEVDKTISLLVKFNGLVPASPPNYDVVLTAQSSAQPDATGAIATIENKLNVTSSTDASCPTCVTKTFVLHNVLPVCATSCNTVAQTLLPLDVAIATASTLSDFDTDIDNNANTSAGLRAGRRLQEGGAGLSETNVSKVVRWSRQMGEARTVAGNAVLQLHVSALAAGIDGNVDYLVQVIRRPQGNGSSATVLGEVVRSVAYTDGSSFQLAAVSIPVPQTSFSKNDRIEVRVMVLSDIDPLSTDLLRLAYDTTTFTGTFSYGVIP